MASNGCECINIWPELWEIVAAQPAASRDLTARTHRFGRNAPHCATEARRPSRSRTLIALRFTCKRPFYGGFWERSCTLTELTLDTRLTHIGKNMAPFQRDGAAMRRRRVLDHFSQRAGSTYPDLSFLTFSSRRLCWCRCCSVGPPSLSPSLNWERARESKKESERARDRVWTG